MITPQFLQNCQAGDETAIESLVRSHQRGVFQIALSVLDDSRAPGAIPTAVLDEAEIATRQTFTAALDRLGRYREDTPFEPWLYGIAVQVSRRRFRWWRLRRWFAALLGRAGRRARSVSGQPDLRGAPAPAADPRVGAGDAELWNAVRALPESLRVAVVLRYYHEMSIEDIARVLRSSEGAVHARLDAARERIAREAA